MTYQIAVDRNGKHQVFRTVNGIYRLDIGPAWPTPRLAIDYSDALEAAEHVSPLRVSGEESTADPAGPLPGSGPSDSSPEPRQASRVGTGQPTE
jgi:hypothetical protein